MKKIVLVGKFNEVTKELSDFLSQTCQVQLCSANPEILKGMLRLTEPDVVIVSLVELSMAAVDIVRLLSIEFKPKPVVVVGGKDDMGRLADERLLSDGWIRFLCRPVKAPEIAKFLESILNPNGHKKTGHKKEEREEKKTILVVDDSPMFLRTIRAVLAKKYNVLFATSGHLAITTIAKEKPDLVLLDYTMPECDGAETLKMIRADDDMKDIPVVFLTANAKKENVMKVLELKPDDYLLKPPSEARLFATIEDVLNNRKEQQEALKKKEGKDAGGTDATKDVKAPEDASDAGGAKGDTAHEKE